MDPLADVLVADLAGDLFRLHVIGFAGLTEQLAEQLHGGVPLVGDAGPDRTHTGAEEPRGRVVDTSMNGFRMWPLIAESGRLDRDGFNDEFRRQLAALVPRVHDAGRRTSLEAVREFEFLGHILTALRYAGLLNRQEREEAAHDVAVYLLVQPGQLFVGYNPMNNGPMPARLALAVRDAVRIVLRSRATRAGRVRAVGGGGDVPAAIPDRDGYLAIGKQSAFSCLNPRIKWVQRARTERSV